jgi:hypothetical protein
MRSDQEEQLARALAHRVRRFRRRGTVRMAWYSEGFRDGFKAALGYTLPKPTKPKDVAS